MSTNLQEIHISEVLLGDVIQPIFNSPFPYSIHTVYKIENGMIYLRRPFCYSKGCSTDVEFTASAEEYAVYQNPSTKEKHWFLLERSK